jgi:hypothetical protein
MQRCDECILSLADRRDKNQDGKISTDENQASAGNKADSSGSAAGVAMELPAND